MPADLDFPGFSAKNSHERQELLALTSTSVWEVFKVKLGRTPWMHVTLRNTNWRRQLKYGEIRAMLRRRPGAFLPRCKNASFGRES